MPLPKQSDRPATYKDVLDAPEHMIAEIIHGVLHMQPRPTPKHALAASYLGDEIISPFGKGRGGPGGWWILFEPELHLNGDVLVPDLAGWRRERMPTMPDEAWFSVSPDWVCEALSPRTRKKDLTEKREIYAEHGVRHLWSIDPRARTLETFALHAGEWRRSALLHEDAEVRQPPFDAIAFPLAVLWP